MGENSESREAPSPNTEIPDPFEYEEMVEERLKLKYKTVRPQGEARRDALIVASTRIATGTYSITINPDADEAALKEDVDKWKQAIDDSKTGEWGTLRQRLQEEGRARLALASKNGILLPQQADFKEEDIGKSYLNLARSL